MSDSWRNRRNYRWYRRMRIHVLTRDSNTCQLRIPGTCTKDATCVHHTKGKRYGDDPAEMVAACDPCNLHVGDPEVHARACTTCRSPEIRHVTSW